MDPSSFADLGRHLPVLLLKPSGEVVAITTAAERLLGVSPGMLLGRSWPEGCADAADAREYLGQCARSLEPLPGSFKWRVRDTPMRFRCEGYASLLRDDPSRVIVLQFRNQDATTDSFVLLKQKLVELNAELLRRRDGEARLDEALQREHRLFEAAESARHDAERSSRAKDEFLAMLGHELRNPLAPIFTAVHLMRSRKVGADKELNVIERQLIHFRRLVDDLLDVSRIASGKIELTPEPVELSAVVEHALEMASPLIQKGGHHVEVSVAASGLPLMADRLRLSQIVFNLLSNAAKYSNAGGTITLVAVADEESIALEVRDTGIGIDADLLQRVFNLFFQDRQALDRAQGGLGLGLAIVDSLVKLHGGSVTATSEGIGRGSAFTIRLPRNADVRTPTPTRPKGAPPNTDLPFDPPLRILVVDDNQEAAELLSLTLDAVGHDTRTAHAGAEALEAAGAFLPEVAILDIGLPGMDGYELAARFQSDASLRDVALVALTGYGQSRDRERALAAGFDVHMIKPVEIPELLSTIRRLGAVRRHAPASANEEHA